MKFNIKNIFKSKQFNIEIDKGLFTITTKPLLMTSKNTKVFVFRTIKMPNKFTMPSILVRNKESGEYINIYIEKTDNNGQSIIWSFIMPSSDVMISPAIKRRGKH